MSKRVSDETRIIEGMEKLSPDSRATMLNVLLARYGKKAASKPSVPKPSAKKLQSKVEAALGEFDLNSVGV